MRYHIINLDNSTFFQKNSIITKSHWEHNINNAWHYTNIADIMMAKRELARDFHIHETFLAIIIVCD